MILSLDPEDPLEKGMATTAVFLPGEFQEQRSLEDYSSRGCKELDTAEWLTLSLLHDIIRWSVDMKISLLFIYLLANVYLLDAICQVLF